MARAKNPNVKVLLALGGWTDSGTSAYSKLVSKQENIDNFVEKAVAYLKVDKIVLAILRKFSNSLSILNSETRLRRLVHGLAVPHLLAVRLL